MSTVTPIAARLGFTHVSICQTSSGSWHAVLWSADDGPTPLPGDGTYHGAVDQARSYADRKPFGCVLDLPDSYRTIDVVRTDSGAIQVRENSMDEGSSGVLGVFGPHERDDAVVFALNMRASHAPCKLGSIDP